MDGSLVIFGNWLQNRSFALAIAGSDWAYPLVQASHFTRLSIWIGTSASTCRLASRLSIASLSVASLR